VRLSLSLLPRRTPLSSSSRADSSGSLSLSLSFARAAYSLRNSIEGDLKDKLEADDKESLDKAITETISWLDASSEASKEEYEEKQKELEGVANRASLFLPSSSSSSPSPSFLPRPPRPRTSC